MKTEELVAVLANDVRPVERNLLTKRLALALLLGVGCSFWIMSATMGLPADLLAFIQPSQFWARLLLPGALLLSSLALVARLSQPGRSLGMWGAAPVCCLAAGCVVAALILYLAPPEQRWPLLFGRTWSVCPTHIAVLSLPVFVSVMWAAQGMAPTRLRLTGGAAGLLAGSVATVLYCIQCPEMSVPFWTVWYVLGMAIPTVVGALLGPRLLRW